jgi:hypothetical protein
MQNTQLDIGTLQELRMTDMESIEALPVMSGAERAMWVKSALKQFGYFMLSREDKGLVRTYIQAKAHCSRAQMTRYIADAQRQAAEDVSDSTTLTPRKTIVRRALLFSLPIVLALLLTRSSFVLPASVVTVSNQSSASSTFSRQVIGQNQIVATEPSSSQSSSATTVREQMASSLLMHVATRRASRLAGLMHQAAAPVVAISAPRTPAKTLQVFPAYPVIPGTHPAATPTLSMSDLLAALNGGTEGQILLIQDGRPTWHDFPYLQQIRSLAPQGDEPTRRAGGLRDGGSPQSNNTTIVNNITTGGGTAAPSGWTDATGFVYLTTGTDFVGIGTQTPKTTLEVVGSISGSSLYIASSIEGAGLASCDPVTQKILWNAITKQFYCGTDNATGTGLSQATGDQRYVQKQGDTMTGALTINITNGNAASIGLRIINTLSGAQIHAEKSLTTSGTLVFEGAASGSSLYLGTSLQGAGLVDCSTAGTSKLLWNAVTGRFSCGTDTDTNTTYTGGQGIHINGTIITLNSALSGSLLRFTTISGSTVFAKNSLATSGSLIVTGNGIIRGSFSGSTIHAEKSLTSSGTITADGAISGASLFIGGSIRGAGLVSDCNTSSSALQWNATTGRFTCGTISGVSGTFSTGNVLAIGNAMYVSKQGDTMTGALTVRIQGGTLASLGINAANTISGAIIHAEKSLTTSGTLVFEGAASGSSLYIASSLKGAGLVDCSTTTTSKLLWNAATGRFSCGTDQNTGTTYTAGQGLILNGTSFSLNTTISGSLIRFQTISGSTIFANTTLRSSGSLIVSGSATVRGSFSGSIVHAEKSITSSGTITAEGVISGASLFIGTSIKGAGLADCNTATSALQWTASSGRFSCGTIATSSPFSTGNVLTIGNAKYLSKQGGTLTGALIVNVQNGNLASVGINAVNTISGAVVHGEKSLTTSGTLVFEGAASGSSLYLGTSLKGAGLVDCSTAGTSKLLWNAASGRFSCGTDTDTNTTYTAGQGLSLNGTVITLNATITGSLLKFATVSGSTVFAKNTLATSGSLIVSGNGIIRGSLSGSIIHAEKSITSSGTITAEGTISGASLFIGTSIKGAGLVSDCNTATSALQWTASTGRFSCGTIATSSPFSTGNVLTIGNQKYVSKQGDTMTGALIVNVQNGNLASVGINAVNTISGALIHAQKGLTTSGALVFEGAASGSSLYLGTSLNGAGLADCSTAGTSKLLWNAASGRFSCGTDANTGTTYTAGQGLTLNGSAFSLNATITGSLVRFNTISGSTLFAKNTLASSGSLKVLGTSSGSIFQADTQLRSSGTLVVNGIARFKNNVNVLGILSGASLSIMNGNSYLMGNVGIGKNGAPNTKLEVNGTISGSIIYANKGLNSSGTITAEGAISGASLFIGTSIKGAGLVSDCNTATSALQWTAATGRFSCGTIATSSPFSTGNVLTIGNQKYVSKQGDTMTGALVINMQNGTAGTIGLKVLNTLSGAIIHAERSLTTSGTIVAVGTISTKGTLSGAALTVMNGTSYLMGDVGIGITSPTGSGVRRVQIAGIGGSAGSYGSLALSNASNSQNNSVGALDYYGASTLVASIRTKLVGASTNGDMQFFTALAGSLNEGMRLTSAGFVGIGTTAPHAKLDVAGIMSGATLVVSGNGAFSGRILSVGNIATKATLSGAGLTIMNTNSYLLGNVGIGKSGTPNAKLEVVGTISGTTINANNGLNSSGTITAEGAISGASLYIGTSIKGAGLVSNCNTSTSALQWTAATGRFSCGTIASSSPFSTGNVLTIGNQKYVSKQGDTMTGTLVINMQNGTAGTIGLKVLNTLSGAIIHAERSLTTSGTIVAAGNMSTKGTLSGAALTVMSGNSYLLGNVGIGKSGTPNTKLEVAGTISGSVIYATNSLRSSGTIVAEGAISGASLYIGTSIKGAGLVSDCNTATSALQWTAATGRFSCGTIATSSPFSTGNVLTIGNQKYVSKQGDTMTGTLIMNIKNGTLASLDINAANTISGAIVHTEKSLTTSGTLVFEGAASGASLFLGTSLKGAGLVDCSTAGTSKLLWNAASGRFSCGTDTDTNTTYTAGQGLSLNGTIITLNASLSGSLLRFTTISGSTVFAANSLRSSGSIVAEGAISGASLFIGTSINGAGLGDCSTALSSKLLWSASTGRFSCGTDQTAVANISSGNVLTLGDARYVKKSGDTMTGALTIQNGNTGTPTTTPLLNVRGTMSGRGLVISGTGAFPLLSTNPAMGMIVVGSGGLRAGSGYMLPQVYITPRAPVLIGNVTTTAAVDHMALQGSTIIMTAGTVMRSFDVTNPSYPKFLATGTVTSSNPASIVLEGKYAFIAVSNKIQSFDISNPSVLVPLNVFTPTSSVNALAIQGRYLFSLNTTSAKFQTIDISNPANMVSAGTASTGTTPSAIAVQGRYAYITNSGGGTMQIIDLKNPTAPVSIGTTSAGTTPNGIAVQGRYAYVLNSAGLQIFDISNPSSVGTLGSVASGASSAITVVGRYAYVVGINGLQTIDISDPRTPFVASTVFNGLTTLNQISVQGRYAYVSYTGGTRLYVFDLGGESVQNADIGSLEVGSLTIHDALQGMDANFQGSISAATSLFVAGHASFGTGGQVTIGTGGLIARGPGFSGSSVYVTSSFQGAGLTNCTSTNNAVQWNSSTGRFSCGTIASGSTFSSGNVLTIGNAKYVSKQGDTMTGALIISIQNGTLGSIGLKVLNTMSGAIIHADKALTSSGSIVVTQTGATVGSGSLVVVNRSSAGKGAYIFANGPVLTLNSNNPSAAAPDILFGYKGNFDTALWRSAASTLSVNGTLSGYTLFANNAIRSSGSIVAEGAISGASLYIGTSIKGAGLVSDCNASTSALQWTASTGRFSCGTIIGGGSFGTGNVLTIGDARYVNRGIDTMTGTLKTKGYLFASGATLSEQSGFNAMVNLVNAGLATHSITRLTPNGNLVNIGSIQSGEINATMGGTFVINHKYATTGAVRGIDSADLNGDGYPDIVSVTTASSIMSVFINTGTGGFKAPVDYGTGTNPRNLVIADFNGDGKPDVATANYGDNTVSIFMNKGNGAFNTLTTLTGIGNPYAITAADLNGDGLADLIVVNNQGPSISVFMNKGKGRFSTKTDYAAGSYPTGVSAADLNGDGKVDVAVSSYNTNTVGVFLNTGDGILGTRADYTTGTSNLGAYAVKIGDMNGDNKPDLVTPNLSDTDISILKNNGDGTFTTHTNFATSGFSGETPNDVQLADLNGDGKLDVVVTNNLGYDVETFLNSGTGGLVSHATYTMGVNPVFSTVADFNGDGKPDIATTVSDDHVLAIMFNKPQTILYASSGTGGYVSIGTSRKNAKFTISNTTNGSGAYIYSSGAVLLLEARTQSGAINPDIFFGYHGNFDTKITRTGTGSLTFASNTGTLLTLDTERKDSTGNVFQIISDATTSFGGPDENKVFRIQANGATFSDNAYSAAGADYAEWFYSGNEKLTPGEVVCIDITKNNAVKRCTNDADGNVMGVVSTNPAFVGNSISGAEGLIPPGYALIGLIGQVPTKVMVSGTGSIRPGDSLTAASTPGFARKAMPGESTLGVALEGMDHGTGTINVLISRRNSSVTVDAVGQKVLDTISSMKIGDEVQLMVASSLKNLNVDDQIQTAVQNQVTNLKASAADILSLQTEIDQLKNDLNTLKTQTGSTTIITSSGTSVPSATPLPSDLTANTLSLENTLNVGSDAHISGDLHLDGTLMASSLFVPNGLTIDGGETVTGMMTATTIHTTSGAIIDGTLTVNGNIRVHSGALLFDSGSTVHLSDLIVDHSLMILGNITIQGMAEFLGDVVIHGELRVSGRQAGTVTIPAGTKSVTVHFSSGFTAVPVITATPNDFVLSPWRVKPVSATGFTIEMAAMQADAVTFSWHALISLDSTSTTAETAVPDTSHIFPLGSDNIPVSSDMAFNACIRNYAMLDGSGKPLSCSKYHDDYTWHQPDLLVDFLWNTNVTPPLLVVPDGYSTEVTENAENIRSAFTATNDTETPVVITDTGSTTPGDVQTNTGASVGTESGTVTSSADTSATSDTSGTSSELNINPATSDDGGTGSDVPAVSDAPIQ